MEKFNQESRKLAEKKRKTILGRKINTENAVFKPVFCSLCACVRRVHLRLVEKFGLEWKNSGIIKTFLFNLFNILFLFWREKNLLFRL